MQTSKAMNSQRNQRLMTQYLLGELSAEDRAKFEEQYAADVDLFEGLVAVENDLVDGYANGTLSEVERKQFESHYLNTPQRRKKAELAKSLMNYCSTAEPVSPTPDPPGAAAKSWPSIPGLISAQTRALRWVAAVVFLFVIASSLWLQSVNRRLRHELQDLQAHQAALEGQTQQLQQQIAQLTSAGGSEETAQLHPPGQTVAFLTLEAGLRSGDQENILTVTSSTSSAVLRLRLDSRVYPRYAVVLETADEATIWHQRELRSHASNGQGKALFVTLPAYVLKSGDYILKLTGIAANGKVEDIDEYGFRIVNR